MNCKKIFLLMCFFVCAFSLFAQQQTSTPPQNSKVKRADVLFNDFAYVEAIKLYEESVRDGNIDAYVCKKLADANRKIGNTEQSEHWYRTLIDMGTNEPLDYYYYAQSLKSNKKYKEAEKWIKKFSEWQEQDSRMKREVESIRKRICPILDSNSIEVVKLSINSRYSDFSPAFYKDKVVFASSRDTFQNRYVWDKQPFIDLFVCEKDASLQLKNVTPFSKELNSPYHEGPMTFDETGNTIYFTRNNLNLNGKLVKNAKDKINNLKIYSSHLVGNVWGGIKEFPYNSDDFSTGHPTLSKDGNKIYFASDRPGGYGQADVYVCTKQDGEWGEPQNLGETVNTEGNEMFPFLINDSILLFSSDGLVGFGGLDIFLANLQSNGEWKITNMGYPLNSPKDDFGAIINEEMKWGYFSSNRKGTEGKDDIYAFKFKKIISQTPPDSTNLVSTNVVGGNVVGNNPPQNNSRGQTQNVTPPQNTLNPPIDTANTVIFNGKTVKVGETFVLENIYYDLDKYNIRPDAAVELNKVIRFMILYPNAVIELSSHTDSRASFEYNATLSQNRAKSAAEYICKSGNIDPKRIIYKGYGETKLVNNCSDGVNCSETDHQLNRRTEITILKK